jgi:hypothetical protein
MLESRLTMHANGVLLTNLFTALGRHDAAAMAACYREEASFTDIAFRLSGRRRIHAMWRMICETDIRAEFEIVHADDRAGRVRLVDDYTFSDTKRPVHNVIDSRFVFRDGLIAEHIDSCDERLWARQALGGIKGLLAGRFRFLRARTASDKLDAFIERSPEH